MLLIGIFGVLITTLLVPLLMGVTDMDHLVHSLGSQLRMSCVSIMTVIGY